MNRNQLECLLRLYLGAQQLVSHPCTVIPILGLGGLFIVAWYNKNSLIPLEEFPQLFRPILQYSISTILIISFLVFLFCWIGWLGYITAKKDERNLAKAFKKELLYNECPILIYRKKWKDNGVTVRVFYSDIPLDYWIKRKNDIAHHMDISYVRLPDYGGKNSNSRKLILMHTTPGRNVKDRGALYDEEL